MLALIDGDIVLHRVGYTTEQESFGIAKARADEMLDGILLDTSATEYRVYFSDTTENGFRKQFYPEYKANRILKKPQHYDALKEYMITEWSAIITPEQEADDALGIDQVVELYKFDPDPNYWDQPKFLKSCICSIDKDLLQIPGLHWNFVKKEWFSISREEGLKRFYHQLLMGDTSDNVRGIEGVGKVRATGLLQGLEKEEDLFGAAVAAYKKWLQKEWQCEQFNEFLEKQMYNLILVTGRVLKIRQKENEIWQFPKEYAKHQPYLEETSLSTPCPLVEHIQSTEPTKQKQETGFSALGQSREDFSLKKPAEQV